MLRRLSKSITAVVSFLEDNGTQILKTLAYTLELVVVLGKGLHFAV